MSGCGRGGMPRRAYARLRPWPGAMKVSTNVLSETPSALARVVSWAWTVLGTRATNFPEAMPPLFGAGTGSLLVFSAAIVAFNASVPFVIASSTVYPPEMQSEKSV